MKHVVTTFAERLDKARQLIANARRAGLEIDDGNVRDLILDNMPRENVATAGDLVNSLCFSVVHVAGMVTGESI